MGFKNNSLTIFSRIGKVQILPVILSLVGNSFFCFILVLLLIFGIEQGRSSSVAGEEFFYAFCIIIFFLITTAGLILFLISSYYFIQAKRKRDFSLITEGMKHIVWASTILCLFTIIFLIFSLSELSLI